MKSSLKHLIISLLFFVSCNEDDQVMPTIRQDGTKEIPITSTSQIHGTWKYQEMISENEVDLNTDEILNTDLFKEIPLCILDDHIVISDAFTNYYIDNKELTCNPLDEPNGWIQEGTYSLVLDPRRNFLTLFNDSLNNEYPLVHGDLMTCLDIVELSFPNDNKRYIEFYLDSGSVFINTGRVRVVMQKVQ